ncbi:hypothetical protein FHG87_012148 [Trinorchestia longiramus]|nr:hypothetical protein FHG87_012148 [Trinorchestia longiramus]
MELNQYTKKLRKRKTTAKKYRATYNLQFFNKRNCNAENCRFCYFNHESSLQQHANELTKRNNIVNVVMMTSHLRKIELKLTDKIGDHQTIDFVLKVHDPNTRTRQKHVLYYKRENFKLMKEELSDINYEVLIRNKNAEQCYAILNEKNCNCHKAPNPNNANEAKQ